MSTRTNLVINRRRNAKVIDHSERYSLGASDRIADVLSEVEVLLAACTSAEKHAFWLQLDQIKAKHRKSPELPVFTNQPPTFCPIAEPQNSLQPQQTQTQSQQTQSHQTQPELPEFLVQRRPHYRDQARGGANPELPSFLEKRSQRNYL